MRMPMRSFWQFSGYTDRLLTAENIDHLQLLVCGQDGEAAANAIKRMGEVAPNPVKYTARAIMEATSSRDEAGFNELRGMS